jgi:hypothetical protein
MGQESQLCGSPGSSISHSSVSPPVSTLSARRFPSGDRDHNDRKVNHDGPAVQDLRQYCQATYGLSQQPERYL